MRTAEKVDDLIALERNMSILPKGILMRKKS